MLFIKLYNLFHLPFLLSNSLTSNIYCLLTHFSIGFCCNLAVSFFLYLCLCRFSLIFLFLLTVGYSDKSKNSLLILLYIHYPLTYTSDKSQFPSRHQNVTAMSVPLLTLTLCLTSGFVLESLPKSPPPPDYSSDPIYNVNSWVTQLQLQRCALVAIGLKYFAVSDRHHPLTR